MDRGGILYFFPILVAWALRLFHLSVFCYIIMKRFLLSYTSTLLATATLLFALPGQNLLAQASHPFDQADSGTDGTSDAPYKISTIEHLNAIRGEYLDDHFLLTMDLDFSGYTYDEPEKGWLPIGHDTDAGQRRFQGTPFSGSFDGAGRVIRDLRIDRGAEDYVGLFGSLGSDGSIVSLGLEDLEVTGVDPVGGLVGYNNNGTVTGSYATGSVTGDERVGGLVGLSFGPVTDSYATGSVTGDDNNVGGLVGYGEGTTVMGSYATGSVTGKSGVGGLVGHMGFGTVMGSYATGSVTGSGSSVGGLVGLDLRSAVTGSYATGSVTGKSGVGGLVGDNNSGTVTGSYATGSVTGDLRVGGLVGRNTDTVTQSYATGSVTGGSNVGGLVGENNSGTVTQSYWNTQLSGHADSSVGVGLTTAEMFIQGSFAGFDFTGTAASGDNPEVLSVWKLPVLGVSFPHLREVSKNGQVLSIPRIKVILGLGPFSLVPTFFPPTITEAPVFSSDPDTVATIHPSSGEITLAAGAARGDEVTITVRRGGDSIYSSVIGSQVLQVTMAQTVTISEGSTLSKAFGDLPFTLTAIADTTSGLSDFTWVSSNSGVVTVTGGSTATVTVMLVGVGMTTLTVQEPGDEEWEQGEATVTLTVTKGMQLVSVTPGPSLTRTFGTDTVFDLTATGDAGSGLVSFVWSSGMESVATVSPAGQVTIMGAGVSVITVQEPGNGDWESGEATVTLTVTKGMQLVSVTPGPSLTRTFGTDTVFDLTATGDAGSGLVSFVWSSGMESVATVSPAGQVTIMGAGVSVITVQEPGNGDWESGEATVTLTVSKGVPQISGFPESREVPLLPATFALGGTSSSGETITYSVPNTDVITISGDMATITGSGTVVVTATVSATANWEGVTQRQALTVADKMGQILTFAPLPDKRVGDLPFPLSATSSESSLTSSITFSSSDESVATVMGSTVTVVGSGMTDITATQAGSAEFVMASVVQTLRVFPPVLTFGSQMILPRNYLQGTLITPLSLPEATGGTGPYTYTLDPVPAGLSFDADPASRTLSGTPDATQALTEHTYTVTDSAEPVQTATLTFTITVLEAGTLTFMSPVEAQTYTKDVEIEPLTLPEAIGGMGPYTYTLVPEPAGLSFDDDPASRTLSGTPDATQALTEYTYTVTDSAEPAQTATLTFTITVIEVGTLTFMPPSVEAQTYTKDTAITPLTLPEAMGGTGALHVHPHPGACGLDV